METKLNPLERLDKGGAAKHRGKSGVAGELQTLYNEIFRVQMASVHRWLHRCPCPHAT